MQEHNYLTKLRRMLAQGKLPVGTVEVDILHEDGYGPSDATATLTFGEPQRRVGFWRALYEYDYRVRDSRVPRSVIMSSRRKRKRQRASARQRAGTRGDRAVPGGGARGTVSPACHIATPRGDGGPLPEFPETRADLVLLRHAINADWTVPTGRRGVLIENTSRHIELGNTRSVLAAAQVLLAADRANLRGEQKLLAQVQGAAEQQACTDAEPNATAA